MHVSDLLFLFLSSTVIGTELNETGTIDPQLDDRLRLGLCDKTRDYYLYHVNEPKIKRGKNWTKNGSAQLMKSGRCSSDLLPCYPQRKLFKGSKENEKGTVCPGEREKQTGALDFTNYRCKRTGYCVKSFTVSIDRLRRPQKNAPPKEPGKKKDVADAFFFHEDTRWSTASIVLFHHANFPVSSACHV